LLFSDFGPGEPAYRVLEKLKLRIGKNRDGYREYGFPIFLYGDHPNFRDVIGEGST
jgi:hypothetical protein